MKKQNFFTQFLKKIKTSGIIFIVLVLCFGVFGFVTLGSTSTNYGKSTYLGKDSALVLKVEYGKDQRLDEVHINVGTVYAEEGATVALKLTYSSTGSSWLSSSLPSKGEIKFDNIVNGEESTALTGINFNYAKVIDEADLSSSYKYFKLTTNTPFELNEIVFVADDGQMLPVSVVYENASSKNISKKADAYNYGGNAIDSQTTAVMGNFSTRFTTDEIYTNMMLQNMGFNTTVVDGVYLYDGHTSAFSLLLIKLGTLIFGNGTFGARFMPFLFTLANLILGYFLCLRLFKNDKAALGFAGAFVLFGTTLSAGRLALSFSFTTLFALVAVWFCYDFYAKGVSDKDHRISALKVLYSSLAAALMVVSDFKSLIFVAGLIGLFVAGMIRQNKYKKDRISRLQAIEDADQMEERRLRSLYKDKNLTCVLYALVGVAGAVLLSVISSIATYVVTVKAFDTALSPSMNFFMVLAKNISASFAPMAENTCVMTMFVPFMGGKLFAEQTVVEEVVTSSRMFAVSVNYAVLILSLVSLVYAVVIASVAFAKNKNDKEAKSYYAKSMVILGAVVLSFVMNIATMTQASALFFVTCLALAVALSLSGNGKGKKGMNIFSIVCFSLSALLILFMIPSIMGIMMPQGVAQVFNWTFLR